MRLLKVILAPCCVRFLKRQKLVLVESLLALSHSLSLLSLNTHRYSYSPFYAAALRMSPGPSLTGAFPFILKVQYSFLSWYGPSSSSLFIRARGSSRALISAVSSITDQFFFESEGVIFAPSEMRFPCKLFAHIKE